MQNNIINEKLEWAFGENHLVLLGDFFDRGNDVTALLWLCYKLESEAKRDSGHVHFILGNHEQMNLQGNEKYVQEKYKALANKLNVPYKELYGKKTELGRWLRSKNSIEIIGDILFCHGGVSPRFVELSETIEETNNNIRKALDTHLSEVGAENEEKETIWVKKYLGNNGPLWYRGYFRERKDDYEKATQKDIDIICDYYEVNKMIVGHTVVDEIRTYFNGKVIGVDVLRYYDNSKNKPSALLIENEKFYAVNEFGQKYLIR
ncbi:MAG: hypothetical protein HC831_10175 [Chloroflexia bacterium]|nr:hypothetical protein [Chloroflexia bacterium]